MVYCNVMEAADRWGLTRRLWSSSPGGSSAGHATRRAGDIMVAISLITLITLLVLLVLL